MSAELAQPSGLAVSLEHEAVFIADSESSSIRKLSLKDGRVSNVVGGDVDPTVSRKNKCERQAQPFLIAVLFSLQNLFSFGDVDGVGTAAKLQHPLGVCWTSSHSNNLYAIDSYNHKVKQIDLTSMLCCSVTFVDSVLLNEPGGACFNTSGTHLYIADTNNNCIRVLEVDDGKVSEVSWSPCLIIYTLT